MNNNYYKGFPILGNLDDFNTRYLDRMIDTINYACDEHNRVYVLRVDLHLPQAPQELDCLSRDEVIGYSRNRDKLMSRFIDSLKAKISAQDRRSRRLGSRVYPTSVRYIWCRERIKSENDHYHVVLLFNKDKYHSPGNYLGGESLSSLINSSWLSALGLRFENKKGLVHFTEGNGKYLDSNSPHINEQRSKLFHHVSYLAKKYSKNHGEGKRNFGCSQR